MKSRRKASGDLVKRFFSNYSRLISRTGLGRYDSYESLFKAKFRSGELRPMDLIWDASTIILKKDVASYNKLYSFLSLSGFFRTLTVVSIILTILCVWPVIIYTDIYTFLLIGLMFLLIILSYINYVKFDRMYIYQVIRSFSLLGIADN